MSSPCPSPTRRLCFALDLRDDPSLIAEYEAHHRSVWPHIKHSIAAAGVVDLSIYRLHTRLFMIMEVDDTFDAERKRESDESDEMVQAWEELMWKYQQPLPWAAPGQKWMEMTKIFDLGGEREGKGEERKEGLSE